MENKLAYKLRELRENKGLSLQNLADLIGVAKQSIFKFEKGLINPTTESLLKISTALGIPFSSFYEDDEYYKVSVDKIKFREKFKIINESFEIEIKEQISTSVSKFIELSSILKDDIEYENPIKELQISSSKDIEKAAKIVRKKWKIGSAPIVDVIDVLESKGIFVVEVNSVEDFTGLCAIVNDTLPVVVLNDNFNSIERKRFTALHELGHILLTFMEGIGDKEIERFCDMFAGAMLLVDDILFQQLGKERTVITVEELRYIKELYGISIQAIIMRAYNSGFINETTLTNWWQQYKEWYNDGNNSIDFGTYQGIEKPVRFKKLIKRGIIEKRLSIAKAAELSNTKIDIIRKELNVLNFSMA